MDMKKARTRRIGIALLAALLCLALLAGCGATFDAARLVKGNLDVLYLGKIDPEYLALVSDTEEACRSHYEQGLEVEAEFFAEYFEIVLDMCPDTTKDEIIDLYREIYSHSWYEVGDATRSDDTYLVSLTVHPIDIMQKIMDEDAEIFMEDYYARIEAGEYDDMSEEEYEAAWAEGIIEMVRARLDNIDYLEPETISVQITADDEGYYSISDNDFQRIDALMIQY